MTSITQVRSQLRSLEAKTESLLSSYSTYARSGLPRASEEEVRTASDLEECLQTRDQEIATLARIMDSESGASATKLHQLQRHKEVLQEHRAEFRRLGAAIVQERNRTNLLSNVRSDIESHRVESAEGPDAAEYMLSERTRIDASNSLADTLLAQAYETRDDFVRQRASLSRIRRRLFTAASQIPGLNTIISKVNTRKKRDSVLIASAITLCIVFIWYFS